jgi:hypothetical protein
MIKYCKVYKCRFPVAHTTLSHQCGTCKKNGHGINECGDLNKINNLSQYYNDVLPEDQHCSFGGCLNSKTHTTDSHTCEKCNDRLHSESTCPTNIKQVNITCPICRKINRSTIKSYGSENKCVACFKEADIFLPECGHNCLCLDCSKKLDKNYNLGNLHDENKLIEHNYNILLIKSHLKEYPSYVIVHEGMGCCTLVRRLNSNSNIEGLFVHSDDHYDPNNVRIYDEFINGYCKVDSTIIHDR